MSHDIYENFCRMRELIKQAEESGVEMMAAAYLELEQKIELLELQLDDAKENERDECARRFAAAPGSDPRYLPFIRGEAK